MIPEINEKVKLAIKRQKLARNIKRNDNFFDVSGQLLSFNGQPDLLTYLRDHSAIFPGFGYDFSTLEMSIKLL